MSARDRKPAAVQRLLLPVVVAALAVLAFAMWPGSDVPDDHDPVAGGSRVDAGQPDSSGRPDAEPPVAVETAPPGGDEPPTGARPDESSTEQPHEVLAEMRRAWDCYASPDCRLGDDQDPRAEYFEADKRIAAGMRNLIQQHRAHRITDVELAEAAHEVLSYDSGRGRAAAIEALRRLPPAREHFDVLVQTLDQHHDEKLFELAMPELERYAEQGYRAEVDAFLQSNLRSGAHFPARTIARELGPFLTPDNIDAYRQVARELPPDSPRAENLRATLETYRGGK